MKKFETKLAYLLDVFKISGKDLAEQIGTDATTISKLKKGQRKLTFHSKYTRQIVEYILGKEYKMQRKFLQEQLEQDGLTLNGATWEEQVELLSHWLTTENMDFRLQEYGEMKNVVKTGIYTGLEGWKLATARFWQAARSLSAGEKIYIGDFGEVKWTDLPEEEVERALYHIVDIANRGVDVLILDKVTDSYKPHETLLRWLPAYLNSKIHVRYFTKEQKEFYDQSIYVAQDSFVYTGIRDKTTNQMLEMVHEQLEVVSFYQQLIRSIDEKCRPLYYSAPLTDALMMIDIMDEFIKPESVTYMINGLPSYRNMPRVLLEKILDENDVQAEKRELCLEANRRRRELRHRNNYRQIYNIDEIENALRADYVVEYDLSKILGKEIRISREHFKEQLSFVAKTVWSDTYKVVVPSFRELGLQQIGSFVIQDDSLVMAWDASKYNRRIYSTEVTVAGGYYRFVQGIWDQIPPIEKKEEWTHKQFQRLLEDY